MTDWYLMDGSAVATELGVEPSRGLDGEEAARRLAEHGPNELAEAPRRPAWLRFLDQFNDLLIYILLGAALLSAAVGDLKDPIVIGIVLSINAVLGFVQGNRADDAMAALKKMLEVTVRVRRSGTVTEVPSHELVPGDVVLMEAGDKVPADGRFLYTSSVSIDESTFTGESVPVDKTDEALSGERDTNERTNSGFMNTTLVRGRAEMVVTATGMSTEVGRLAGMLSATEDKPSPLQEQLDSLGKRLAVIAGIAVALVLAVDLARGEDFADAILSAVALAVAAIPEGLPAVVTVTLAIGVSRMAKHQAIIKRLSSVETLGSTNTICSDKTGTLTFNQMTATRLSASGHDLAVSGLGYGSDGEITERDEGRIDGSTLDSIRPALVAGLLCNDAHLSTNDDGHAELVGDPTEGALVVLAAKAGLDVEALRTEHPRTNEVPFDSAVKYMATLHPPIGSDGTAHDRSVLLVKGAPDVVLGRCATVRDSGSVPAQLDESRRNELETINESLGGEGLRVLALASRDLPVRAQEFEGDLDEEVCDLTLEALVGILDPPRPEAIAAVAECREAGIGVKMITGDHASTAGAIAAELGIEGKVVSGAELEEMTDEELVERIDAIGVCARVSPEHKFRVVKALQATGHVVAMTGDGVNDAPALKQADIGVAMGITGTEVTKDAGDMVLTDDNFATIVHAVERGRAIYDNIVTFVRFQLTTNVAAILSILVARLIGWPAPFNPIQVLFVNIIADGPPAMSLGMDPPKPGLMEREPRERGARILSGSRLVRIVTSGAIMAAGTLSLLGAFKGSDEEAALTMAFTTFVFFQMVNALCVRSEMSVFSRYSLTNASLWTALGAVVAVQVLVVQLPFLQNVFGTVSLTLSEWGWCLVTPLVLLIFEEIRKAIHRARSSGMPVA